MKIFKYNIQFATFFKKGLPRIDDRFGVYFICGRQGTGKNYYANKLALAQDKDICKKVKTNVHSLKLPGYEMEYFTKITEIYNDTEPYYVYIIDEISRKWDKNSRTDTQFYAWLNQCRKRHRIAILITQEWKEVPMWLRRPAKYMLCTVKTWFSRFGIYMTSIGDAENMILDKDSMEWECPPIGYNIYKRTKYISDLYDTFEPINEL